MTLLTPLVGLFLPRVVRKGLHVNIGLRLETNSSDLFLILTFITQVGLLSCVSEDNYACEILPQSQHEGPSLRAD